MSEAKDLPSLDCQLVDVRQDVTQKTVGDPMELRCTGLLDQALPEGSQIQFADETQAFALHILSMKSSSASELQALVTSYRPGSYTDPEVYIVAVDDSVKVQLKGLSWTYESVLEDAEKLQKETLQPPPENLIPFPFKGPFSLSYPIWAWLFLGLTLAILSGFVFRSFRKRSQKKKLLEQALSGMGSAQTPLQEFSKIQRKVLRSLGQKNVDVESVLKDLDSGFRSYLVRRYLVPAFDWSEAEVLKDIRKNNPKAYQVVGADVLKLLREFRRIQGSSLSAQDLEQLLEHSRRAVENLERMSS